MPGARGLVLTGLIAAKAVSNMLGNFFKKKERKFNRFPKAFVASFATYLPMPIF
jgi:hypothetical protein